MTIIIIVTILVILVIFMTYQIYEKYNTKSLIENVNDISQITIYNSETHKSININAESEIKKKATKWNQIIVKRDKPVFDMNDPYIVVITYNANGETLETFYTSKEEIVQYHWKLQIIEGNDPYHELSYEFH